MYFPQRCVAWGAVLGSLLVVDANLPAQTPAVPGDTVVTSADGVQFGMRDQPILTVRRGTVIVVTEVRGPWVGGFVVIGGQKRLGWVRASEIRAPDATNGAEGTSKPEGNDEPDGNDLAGNDLAGNDDAQAVATLLELGVELQRDDRQQVRQVVGAGSRLRDSQLELLTRLPRLLFLDLTGLPVTDEGLRYIGACRGLQKLYLSGTGITDQGLRPLQQLARLEVLALSRTAVTGKGLEQLRPLTELRVLSLGDCAVVDADLQSLAAFPYLETLALPRTQVTDLGLSHLKSISLLRVLNLDGTAVTGSGFDQLVGLSELRMLYVRRCPLEPQRADKLDDELPGLAIYD